MKVYEIALCRFGDTTVYNNYIAYNEISFIGLGLLSDMGCIYTYVPLAFAPQTWNDLQQCWYHMFCVLHMAWTTKCARKGQAQP